MPRTQVLGGKTKPDASAELAFQLGEKRVQLGLGMSAVAVHNKSGKREDVVVYFGIIDFLQVSRVGAARVERLRHCLGGVSVSLKPSHLRPLTLTPNIFQEYSSIKKAEHLLKSIRYDSHSISVVNPRVYAGRFQDFMERIFV